MKSKTSYHLVMTVVPEMAMFTFVKAALYFLTSLFLTQYVEKTLTRLIIVKDKTSFYSLC
jgi:hypothetical protein